MIFKEANKKNQAYKKAYKKKFFFLNQKTVLPYSERFVPDDAVIKKQDGKAETKYTFKVEDQAVIDIRALPSEVGPSATV